MLYIIGIIIGVTSLAAFLYSVIKSKKVKKEEPEVPVVTTENKNIEVSSEPSAFEVKAHYSVEDKVFVYNTPTTVVEAEETPTKPEKKAKMKKVKAVEAPAPKKSVKKKKKSE
jgi:predicted small secreted protein